MGRQGRAARAVPRTASFLRHRAVAAHPPGGLPRHVPQDRRPLAAGVDLVAGRPGCPTTGSPTAPRSTCRRPACRRPASTTRSGRPPATTGDAWRTPDGSGRRPAARSSAAARRPARPAPAVRPGPRPAHDRPVAEAAPRSAALPARPAPARCLERYATYTGSDPRRAPAALARRPLRRADLRRLVRPGRPAAARRRAVRALHRARRAVPRDTDVTPDRAAGDRVAGVRLADGDRLPADVVVATPTPPRSTATCCRSRRPAAPAAQGDTVAVGFVLLLGLRGRTPGPGHHTVLFPADYPAEFDAIFGDPAGRWPTRRSTSPPRTTRRCARTATRPGSCWSTRRATTPGAGRGGLGPPGLRESYADRVLD